MWRDLFAEFALWVAAMIMGVGLRDGLPANPNIGPIAAAAIGWLFGLPPAGSRRRLIPRRPTRILTKSGWVPLRGNSVLGSERLGVHSDLSALGEVLVSLAELDLVRREGTGVPPKVQREALARIIHSLRVVQED